MGFMLAADEVATERSGEAGMQYPFRTFGYNHKWFNSALISKHEPRTTPPTTTTTTTYYDDLRRLTTTTTTPVAPG